MLPTELKKNDIILIRFANGKEYKGKIKRLMYNWMYVLVHSDKVGNNFYFINNKWYYRPPKHKKIPDYMVSIDKI